MTKYIDGARSVLELPNFRWTLERYHAAIAAGILTEYYEAELLFGKLVLISNNRSSGSPNRIRKRVLTVKRSSSSGAILFHRKDGQTIKHDFSSASFGKNLVHQISP